LKGVLVNVIVVLKRVCTHIMAVNVNKKTYMLL